MNTHSLSKTSAGQLLWLYQVDLPVLPLRPSFRAEKRRATSVTLTVKKKKKKATQQFLKVKDIYMVLAVCLSWNSSLKVIFMCHFIDSAIWIL